MLPPTSAERGTARAAGNSQPANLKESAILKPLACTLLALATFTFVALSAASSAQADPWKATSEVSCENSSPGGGGIRSTKKIELTKPMKVYRLWGGSATKLGGFWTTTRYSKSDTTRAALGICEEWPDGTKSPLDHSLTCTAPVGTKMCRGMTESVKCGGGTIYKSSRKYQFFIPRSERSKLKC